MLVSDRLALQAAIATFTVTRDEYCQVNHKQSA